MSKTMTRAGSSRWRSVHDVRSAIPETCTSCGRPSCLRAGGNKELVAAGGLHPGNLHRYWDVEFAERLGANPTQVAAGLVGQISEKQRQE
jgi:hypothetical protein